MGSLANLSGGNDLKEVENTIAEVEFLSEEEAKTMSKAFTKNMAQNSTKMKGIFAKAQSNYDTVVDSLSISAPVEMPEEVAVAASKRSLLHSSFYSDYQPSLISSVIFYVRDEDSEKQMATMLNPLQVKITKLNMEIDLANSKARSSEIQR